jgi:hypothetical protein
MNKEIQIEGWRNCSFIIDEEGHKWFLHPNGEYYREPP